MNVMVAGGRERQRLLAGIPVTQRTLDLSGISTPVLEGEAVTRSCCCTVQESTRPSGFESFPVW